MQPKQKQHPVVNVTGDGSNVQYCKDQYNIGTWNVRSMNQGKLEMVEKEMARVNVNILGIRLILNRERSTSRLYIVTLLI